MLEIVGDESAGQGTDPVVADLKLPDVGEVAQLGNLPDKILVLEVHATEFDDSASLGQSQPLPPVHLRLALMLLRVADPGEGSFTGETRQFGRVDQ